MPVSTDKLLLFRSHLSSKGLSEAAQKEISDAAELVRLSPGEVLHERHQPLKAVYLVVHGRLRQTVADLNDTVLVERVLKRGSQFGVLAAAQFEPVPIEVVAIEDSAVLRLDFETAIAFTREHELFGLNLTMALSGMVRDVLLSDRKPKSAGVVVLFHQSPRTHQLTHRLVDRLVDMGESVCLMGDRPEVSRANSPFHPLLEHEQWITREGLRRQISQWGDHDRIILDVDASVDPETASLLIEFSDQVVWCCEEASVDSNTLRLVEIESRSPSWKDKVNLVVLVDSESWVSPVAADLRGLVDRTFVISFASRQPNQGRALSHGIERLVHQLRGVRIGLALGGGGARGMAHLGVLKSLEEQGIVVDMIAGTSAGAMTGVLHAAGYEPDYLVERFSEDLKPGWPFRMLPGGKHWYLVSKYRRGQFRHMLAKYLSDWNLEQLPIPVHSVTVDLIAGKPVVRDRGSAVDAILESINLPVFSKPICRDGQALVDGGLVDNIPADELVKRGCNFIIAVSVTSALESEFAGNDTATITDKMRSPSTLQTVLRSYLVQHVNMNSIGVQPADMVIEPGVAGVDLSDFSQTRQLAVEGERASTESIETLLAKLSRLDDKLFPLR